MSGFYDNRAEFLLKIGHFFCRNLRKSNEECASVGLVYHIANFIFRNW